MTGFLQVFEQTLSIKLIIGGANSLGIGKNERIASMMVNGTIMPVPCSDTDFLHDLG